MTLHVNTFKDYERTLRKFGATKQLPAPGTYVYSPPFDINRLNRFHMAFKYTKGIGSGCTVLTIKPVYKNVLDNYNGDDWYVGLIEHPDVSSPSLVVMEEVWNVDVSGVAAGSSYRFSMLFYPKIRWNYCMMGGTRDINGGGPDYIEWHRGGNSGEPDPWDGGDIYKVDP